MKNIHVLPTDKPSRIYLIKSNNKLGITSNNPEFTENFGSGTQNQHIYITSDEQIKDIRPHSGKWQLEKGEILNKVIMTTDQDLIKDGVQSIDDDFLEWFVKNPSCEEVEVSYEVLKPFQSEEKGYLIHCSDNKVLEEPKQETLNHIVYNIGDSIRIINPTENQPKLFITHKVDNDFGVVYYYQLDGKEESIGFSYIKKEEPKQETLGLKVSEETVYYQVLIVNNKGEKLAFKQNDKWTINASTEEILDQIFKTI